MFVLFLFCLDLQKRHLPLHLRTANTYYKDAALPWIDTAPKLSHKQKVIITLRVLLNPVFSFLLTDAGDKVDSFTA